MPEGESSGSRFIGRRPAVEALRHRLEELRAGRGGVTFLVGGAGVGKSVLTAEVARDARGQGVRVIAGRAPPIDDPAPFSLIRSALETYRAEPSATPDGASLPSVDRSLLDFAPRLAEADASARTGIEQRLLKALDETEERGRRARDEMLARIASQLLDLAEKGPLVLILEDLNRADESSLAAVQYLAEHLDKRPLWILGTTRPPASLSAVGRKRLEQLERALRPELVSVRPLAGPEVEEFLHDLTPSHAPSPVEAAERLAESGGNPALIEQFARRRAAGLEVHGIPTPGKATTGPEMQRILDEASILGPEFTMELLSKVSTAEPDSIGPAIDGLLARGALIQQADGSLQFPEDRLRERAYGHLEEETRRVLHQRAGEAREASAVADQNRIFGLARDFYLGEGDQKSVEYNRIAAEIAERASAPDVAREFLAHALEDQRGSSATDLESEAELVLELSRVSLELGRLEEAEQQVRSFLRNNASAPGFTPRIRNSLEIFLVRVLTAEGNVEEATGIAERVLTSPTLGEAPGVRVGAHAQLRYSLYYAGRYAEALDQNAEVIRLALEAGDERALAYAKLWRAGCLAMIGQADEALLEARQVAVAFDRFGTLAESAAGHLFLGNMLADNRSTPQIRQEALLELRKTIRLAAQAQDPRRVGWAFYHSAELLRFERRLQEAAENATQAVTTLSRIGDRVGQAVSIKVRGQIAMDLGDLGAAEADLTEAHRMLSALHNRLHEIDVTLRLAQLDLVRGDQDALRRRLADLERMNLATARPDLAAEFAELQNGAARPAGAP